MAPSVDDVPTLTDGTVTLRRHLEADVTGVVEQSNDPLSQRWTTVPLNYGTEDAKRFIRDIMPGGWATDLEWGFAVDVEGRYAGTVSLRNAHDARAEIAFGSHPWVRGTGHMTSALRLLLDWGFADRDLQTVIWWANRGNWASRKVAWRLGFSFDGMVRSWLPHRGVLTDAWTGTLLRGDSREPRHPWRQTPVLTGETVTLRPLRDTDVPRIVEACADPDTSTWLGRMPSPYSSTEAIGWLEECNANAATGRAATWAVADPGSDQLLGAVNLFDFVTGQEAEVGYWTHPEARGRGVASEACRLVLQHAFDDLGLRRVRAMAAVENTASRQVLERCGMSQWGVEPTGIQIRSGWVDAACYDVRADDEAWLER
ncbi:GNAT family N-acetyltransferase [Nocardioides sp.]|uniref:GNAT family N-acetyltransferase n=1 Tax=Nocardioides sp. TaxID=35761 RepID=UPI003D14EC07